MGVSFWSDRERRGLPSRADVAVIGAGVSGLSTALALHEGDPTLEVCLVDRGQVGGGASGRSAGMLIPLLGVPWLVEGALPPTDATWAWSELRRRWDQLYVDLAEAGVEVHEADLVLAAPSGPAEAGLNWLRSALEAQGSGGAWLSRDELADRTGEDARGGLAISAARVDPWQLCTILKARAVSAGIEVREQTLVTGIRSDASGVRITTADGGEIRANIAVLAAGAWNPNLHHDLDVGGVFQTYALTTEPLVESQIDRLGGQDVMVATVAAGFAYRRVIGDRLLFGGIDDRVAAPLDGVPAAVEGRLLAMMRSSLPRLGNVAVERVWGGPIHSASLLEIPVLRASSTDPRLILIGGMAGAGLSWGLLAGNLVRGLVRPELDDPDSARLRRCLGSTRVPWIGGAATMVSIARHALLRS